jgi:hypothetical protein
MKSYETIEIKIMLLDEEDIIKTSNNDNVEDLPEFPEIFQ